MIQTCETLKRIIYSVVDYSFTITHHEHYYASKQLHYFNNKNLNVIEVDEHEKSLFLRNLFK